MPEFRAFTEQKSIENTMKTALKGLVKSHLKLYELGTPHTTDDLDSATKTLIDGSIMLFKTGLSIDQVLDSVFGPKMLQETEILDEIQVRFDKSKFRAYV